MAKKKDKKKIIFTKSRTIASEYIHNLVVLQVSQDVSPVDESPGEPLTELLGESGDINQADSCGRTVLHTLAADGNASLLELALAACPQVRI